MHAKIPKRKKESEEDTTIAAIEWVNSELRSRSTYTEPKGLGNTRQGSKLMKSLPKRSSKLNYRAVEEETQGDFCTGQGPKVSFGPSFRKRR